MNDHALMLSGYFECALWCGADDDGEWTLDHGRTALPAPGVPKAANMKEAARVGRAWIAENTEEE